MEKKKLNQTLKATTTKEKHVKKNGSNRMERLNSAVLIARNEKA